MHPAKLILIGIVAALLVGAAMQANGQQTKAETHAKLERLMALKQRADRAEAEQAKADWARHGRQLREKADRAEEGERLKAKGERAKDAQHMKAKAEWAAQGRAQQSWTRRVKWWGENDAAMLRWADAHRYSPLGILIADLEEAVAEDDMERAEQILTKARKVWKRTQN